MLVLDTDVYVYPACLARDAGCCCYSSGASVASERRVQAKGKGQKWCRRPVRGRNFEDGPSEAAICPPRAHDLLVDLERPRLVDVEAIEEALDEHLLLRDRACGSVVRAIVRLAFSSHLLL